MDTQSLSHSKPLAAQPVHRRPWSIIFSIVTFLLGLVVGVMAVVVFLLAISGDGRVLSTSLPPSSSDITVQISPMYLTRLIERDLRASGIGAVQNVQVKLGRGDQVTVNGNAHIILGLTEHVTIVLQPLIGACQLKMHILHADVAGITVTEFVTNFESRINQQLQSNSTNLPAGFVYCQTSVRTDPQGLYITYSAKPA